MSTNSTKSQKNRREQLQGSRFVLPDVDSDTAAVSKESPADKPRSETDPIDYPRLRIRLRDLGLSFAAEYTQSEVALIIRKSARTIREWTQNELMPCHYSPTGRPFYIAQDLEDHFAACERPGRWSK
jgi:hypothetical protein